MKRSALSNSTKKNTLFMEALRRIQNTSRELPWEMTCKHLTDYARCMQISGYSKSERFEAINGAILRHQQMLNEVKSGVRSSMFRNKYEIMASKAAKKVWANPLVSVR